MLWETRATQTNIRAGSQTCLTCHVSAPSRRYTSDFYPPLLSCVYVYVKFGLDWQVLVAEDAVSRALGPPGQTPNPRTKSKQITKEASKTSDSGTRLLAFSLHFTSKRIAYQMKIPWWNGIGVNAVKDWTNILSTGLATIHLYSWFSTLTFDFSSVSVTV
jgi:hypothetical protein